MNYRFSWIDEAFAKWAKKNNKSLNQKNYSIFYEKLRMKENKGNIELSRAGGVLREQLARQRETLNINRIMEKYYKRTKNPPYFMFRRRQK